MVGFADYHAHMFSERSFGQYVFHGRAYPVLDAPPDQQLADSLGECRHGSLRHFKTGMAVRTFEKPHGSQGHPTYLYWPTHKTLLHQQMYVDWVHRAYRHGLRLMVMVITHSQTMCENVHREPGAPCRDDEVIPVQVEAVRRMLDAIERHEGGWMRLAGSATEAAGVIRENRLALVLGVELDTLFGCAKENDPQCKPAAYESSLAWLRGAGVRQINPIHLIDNGFGGTAIFDEYLNINQLDARGTVLQPDPAGCRDPDVDFELRGGVENWAAALFVSGRWYKPHYPRRPAGEEGHCNVRGLSADGKDLIRNLMRGGFLIDIEHMSEKAGRETVQLARARCADGSTRRGCYPLLSSHTWFRDLKLRLDGQDIRKLDREQAADITAEMDRSRETLREIRSLGGVVGVITNHGRLRDQEECPTSSRSVALAMNYAVDQMGVGGGVGFGTDFNGLAGQPSPRFGELACGDKGRGEDRGDELAYPFADHAGELTQCTRAGNRGFDFNVDGLAHYGLLPDLIADLKLAGARDDTIDTLFGSARAYVEMWARAEAAAGTM